MTITYIAAGHQQAPVWWKVTTVRSFILNKLREVRETLAMAASHWYSFQLHTSLKSNMVAASGFTCIATSASPSHTQEDGTTRLHRHTVTDNFGRLYTPGHEYSTYKHTYMYMACKHKDPPPSTHTHNILRCTYAHTHTKYAFKCTCTHAHEQSRIQFWDTMMTSEGLGTKQRTRNLQKSDWRRKRQEKVGQTHHHKVWWPGNEATSCRNKSSGLGTCLMQSGSETQQIATYVM